MVLHHKEGHQGRSLNASLRIQHYLEHSPTFPTAGGLLPHLQAEILQHTVGVKALLEDDEVALGWRTEFLYRNRFNLAENDRHLLQDHGPAPCFTY